VTQIIYEDAVHGRDIEWKAAMKKSFQSFGRLLLNRLLYGLILYGIMTAAAIAFYFVLFLVILALLGPFTASMGGGAAGVIVGILTGLLAVAGVLGMLLFIGYFAMRFGLGTQSVIVENTAASRAISRSHELTTKKFWHSGLTVGIAILMSTMLPTLLASAAYFLVFFDKGLYSIANSAVQIISGIIQPFLTVVLTMLFIDLKIRKEGLDLEAKVDVMLEEEKKREELLRGGEMLNA
jgi:hypothetical protein